MLPKDRTTQLLVYSQLIGLFVSCTGLASLPIGDNAYEVPNDRLQLAWFITLWSLVASALSFFSIQNLNSSLILLGIILNSIISTVSIVYMNFFGGFTRVCHHCAFGCPDYISSCELGRNLFVIGSAIQVASLYGFMLISSQKRQQLEGVVVAEESASS